MGYWGEVTSSIDWCETNYEVTYFIAEFWNSISNVLFIFLGMFGAYMSASQKFEPRFVAMFVGVTIIGIGSTMFHGTLRHVQQQSDETPMVWSILIWFYLLYAEDIQRISSTLARVTPFLLVAYATAYSILHWQNQYTTFFQLHFGFWESLCLIRLRYHYKQCSSVRAKAVCIAYMYTGLVAFALWLMDLHLCEHVQSWAVNPQGHAWWHLLMGINAYAGPAFMQYVRANELGLNPEIRWKWGVAYVDTTKQA